MPEVNPRDFTNKYNTELRPQELARFNNWAGQQSRNPLNDRYDYDIQGWWKNNPGVNLDAGHLTDAFKKPNHPTFSDQSQYHGVDSHQGGQWLKQGDAWIFVPGSTNMYKQDELQNYFNKVEKGNKLQFAPMPGARRAPDGNFYIEHAPGQYARVEANG